MVNQILLCDERYENVYNQRRSNYSPFKVLNDGAFKRKRDTRHTVTFGISL
jgi:hypothetical protein